MTSQEAGDVLGELLKVDAGNGAKESVGRDGKKRGKAFLTQAERDAILRAKFALARG